MEAVGLALSAAQALFAALQCLQLKDFIALWGYKSELDSIECTIKTIQAVFSDVDAMQAHGLELNAMQVDFIEKLKDAVYDADDLLDEIATLAARQQQELQNSKKVRRLLSRFVKLVVSMKLTQELKTIRRKLDGIASDADKYSFKVDYQPIRKRREETSSYVYENEIIGREDEKRRIIDILLDSNTQGDIFVLAIVGMGGLGKTALAQIVYNDPRIQKEFPFRLWVCVSDQNKNQFNAKAILENIYKSINPKEDNIGGLGLDFLVHNLREQLKQNKYLLVLDDIWTEDHGDWLKLKRYLVELGQGENKIVVTTRSEGTAIAVGSNHLYKLQGLSVENSWILFEMVIGRDQANRDDLVEIGKDIVKKCVSVPLAIKVMGSLLHGQPRSKWQTIQQSRLTKIKKDGNDIMPILKFSYYHLSPSLKSCFIFCALFPKDFVIQKEILVNLWMAHDYIEPLDEGQTIEEAAEEYFKILGRRCFFQDFEGSEIDGRVTFKIHDLMHDMAQQVAGNEILIVDSATSGLDKKIRHVYDDTCDDDYAKGFVTRTKVRTYIQSSESSKSSRDSQFVINTLLTNWRSLRALDLSLSDRQSLPDLNAIDKLLHLRYLDLSGSRMNILPKSFTKLINLKFLNLNYCSNLKQLPKDFYKLRNLTTLYVYYDDCGGKGGLRNMPQGIERLTCLSKLNTFIVGHERLSSSNQDIAGLEDVRVPRNLRGHLEIRIAEGYKHTKENGGKGGYLCHTQHLKSISMVWSFEWNSFDKACDPEDLSEEGLLEDMQPHRNLEKLSITRYRGMRIPKWARADGLATFLPNLVKIHIEYCHQLQEFPWLGKLRYLKTLMIAFLHNLEYMEDEISSTCTESSTFFPSLEHLQLFSVQELKGWWQRSSSSGAGPGASGHRLPSFPRLSALSIANCPNLTTIPLCPTVETLELSVFNESLQIMIDEGTDQEEGGGSNGSRNWSTSHDPKMRVLLTDNARHLKSLPPVAFQCVTEMDLSFDYTPESQSLSEFEEVFRSCSSSLLSLDIGGGNLRSVSGGLEHLTALESLRLSSLRELRFDETEKEEKGCTDMPWKCLAHCLRSLELSWLRKVAELPKGMRSLTTLQSLKIVDLPLKGLPEWIGCLSSLQSLEISSCKHFEESLPEALQELTSLQRLEVRRCNQRLHERCKNLDADDWAIVENLAHIVISE